jgi:SAM-dependent methyltransferase
MCDANDLITKMPTPPADSTERFSTRVANYARFRPSYPPEVVDLLKRECGLSSNSVVADIASGTGLFTRMLLETGSEVFGVEPNPEMRAAGEHYLSEFSNFKSIDGTAEATTIAGHSVDIVTAAQAAHWFDQTKARAEFLRILKPGGWLVLLWNEPRKDSTPFLRAYEELLIRYGSDYEKIRNERTNMRGEPFLSSSKSSEKTFEMVQQFDFAGLEGRLLSSSYAPQQGEPTHEPMLQDLRLIFDEYQVRGKVRFEYDTRVFYGRMS